jgi:hypothetical protein
VAEGFKILVDFVDDLLVGFDLALDLDLVQEEQIQE